MAALPPSASLHILPLFTLTEQIQRKLIEILRHLVVTYPRIFNQTVKLTQPPPRPLSWYLLRSAHDPLVWPGTALCARCLSQCTRYTEVILKAWLLTPCNGPPSDLPAGSTAWVPKHGGRLSQCMQVWVAGKQLHPTHELAVYRGLYVCLKCGFIAGHRAAKLVLPCAPATRSGRQNLSRLSQGRIPHGTPGWPEDASREHRAWIAL